MHGIPFFKYPEFIRVEIVEHQKQNRIVAARSKFSTGKKRWLKH